MNKSRKPGGTRTTPPKEPKLSRTQLPPEISAIEWQQRLRRQFGREQGFGLENIGAEPFFSEFRVSNPQSKSSYRVAIRGKLPGDNYCACPDYATNELGTCKHIEFVLAKLEKKRGAKAAFARGYQPPFSELYLRNDGGRAIHFRSGTDCPPAISKAAGRLFDMVRDGMLPPEKFGALERFVAAVAKSGHELRAYDDALDFIAGRRDAERRGKALDELFRDGSDDPQLNKLLKVPLYPYQAEGALFAVRAGRALIGDEMGLGKTIQAIAAAEILARHFGVSKVLVICPTSLKYQWQSEIARFAGRDSRVISGGRAQRQKDYALDEFCKITNYEKLQPDLDLIAAWGPELVIVDEAQRVKNWNTIAARALKRIDSPYAVVLTGTPLENKLEELISIVQFVDQHRLGPTWKLLHEHQVKDEGGRVTGYTGLDKIGQTLAPIMIRRRKSEVLMQLPERTDQNLLVPMTEAQMVYHQENADVVTKIVQRWRKTKFLSDKDQRRLTCALQNMRMACNSTYLLDQESDHGVKADELAALFDGLFEQSGAKAVVFSQWTRTHDIVIRRLEARGLGYVSFHGGVPSEKRLALVERFRDDPACRVFLSTDAGATGLNLQHASILVNMDLPWNPALLEQRIARIHRMGQKRPVQIINFVAKGTIEEGMLSVLAFKRSLAAGILDGGTGEVALGGSRLNRFMKEVENVTGHVGEGEAMTPAEEVVGAGAAVPAESEVVIAGEVETGVGADGTAPPQMDADPWRALAQLGTQLVSALVAANAPAASAHPWIERDPATGVRNLKLPLPPPETARRLADAFSVLADALRGKG
ncbi:DEAD/DEAH box helicase [Thauera chlorobenzoica]|uniref:SWF/SNF family helicase n=1 Tax=Thauera chlorobenzoica TaxID=96773 RepID=A0A1H5V0K4_9RHOO|nr:DEAD/DEAH box helicase [Thauera chlorobenzoica]APR05408.1 SWF/SNF family helicase [Thauera chlorobenzoica]SEF80208.1 Helicase conserved C-terminal domain-containing protein [Thauera chlorobenzoica]